MSPDGDVARLRNPQVRALSAPISGSAPMAPAGTSRRRENGRVAPEGYCGPDARCC
jgi:hypothetical protein